MSIRNGNDTLKTRFDTQNGNHARERQYFCVYGCNSLLISFTKSYSLLLQLFYLNLEPGCSRLTSDAGDIAESGQLALQRAAWAALRLYQQNLP